MTGIFDQYRRHAGEILNAIDRQALHAYKLSFRHPSTNLEMSFESQLPDDMKLAEELLTSEPRTR
jgi:23S rRNA pseudouridine1911/1915/1917 synthase